MLVRTRNKNSHEFLGGMQNGTATLENNLAVSYTVQHTLTIYDPEIPLLGIYSSETTSIITQKPEYKACSSFVLGSSPNTGNNADVPPLGNKQTTVYPHKEGRAQQWKATNY